MNISKCLYPLKANLYVFLNWSKETSTLSNQSQSPSQYLIALKYKVTRFARDKNDDLKYKVTCFACDNNRII